MEVSSRLDKNPDLDLAQKLFLLSHRREASKGDVVEELMKAIKEKGNVIVGNHYASVQVYRSRDIRTVPTCGPTGPFVNASIHCMGYFNINLLQHQQLHHRHCNMNEYCT